MIGACALMAVLVGAAGAMDIDLLVCRDALYQAERSDSMVQPAAVLVGAGFRVGASGMLRLRAGYFGYGDREVWFSESTHQSRTLDGARVQVTPTAMFRTPIDPVSIYAGVGLVARSSLLRHSFWQPDYGYTTRRDIVTLAADQTFLLGVGFELSRRFGLDVEAERSGFSASYGLTRTYQWYEGWEEPVEEHRIDDLTIGWRKSAPTGIGVGLRLKL
jgi:hypothetical protein